MDEVLEGESGKTEGDVEMESEIDCDMKCLREQFCSIPENKAPCVKYYGGEMKVNVEKLEDVLHCCGLDAYTRPSSRSGEEWTNYRLKIAAALLNKCKIKLRKGVENAIQTS